jgi:signal peptide peptidase SppA
MRLIDVVSAPWAITPDMHTEVQGIYARHCRGEKIDIAALEARLGVPLKNAPQPVALDDSGVAVIGIDGVIAKRMNLFAMISGGTSTQLIGQQFALALEDPDVTAIVLAIDSPGGTVDGTQQLADQIYAARGKKPIYAYTDGIMASAAYWIGSAADKVYIAGDTTQVGSIGVIATHVDRSMAQAQNGVRVTEIKAGKYKGQGSPNAPLGAAEVTMQDQVDKLYQAFVDDIARNRGVPVETVQQDMAEGRLFLGGDAIAAGLADGVSTLDDVIAKAAAGTSPASFQAASAGVAPKASQPTQEVTDMLTVDRVKTEAPAVAAALIAEGQTLAAQGTTDAVAAARTQGATGERARLAGIEAQAMPGCEALVAEAKADPKVTPETFAVKVVAFMKERGSKALANLSADAAAAVTTHASAPEQASTASANAGFDPHAVAGKARTYIDEQAKLGNRVSAADAVAHVCALAQKSA